MSKWCKWIAVLMVFTLLVGCSNVGDYVKDHYNLVKADGKGSNMSKVYSVEGMAFIGRLFMNTHVLHGRKVQVSRA